MLDLEPSLLQPRRQSGDCLLTRVKVKYVINDDSNQSVVQIRRSAEQIILDRQARFRQEQAEASAIAERERQERKRIEDEERQALIHEIQTVTIPASLLRLEEMDFIGGVIEEVYVGYESHKTRWLRTCYQTIRTVQLATWDLRIQVIHDDNTDENLYLASDGQLLSNGHLKDIDGRFMVDVNGVPFGRRLAPFKISTLPYLAKFKELKHDLEALGANP